MYLLRVTDGRASAGCLQYFDNRSFALNEELNLAVYDAGIARRLEAALDEDLRYARKISYEEWNSRGIGERLFEWFSFPVRDYL